MTDDTRTIDMEIYEDDAFSYDGYQVVRGEFFAHVYEPSFSLCGSKCSVNTACIKKMPDYDFMQILVNPDEHKLIVRPCKEDEKDSVRWCSATSKRSPKQITCRMFFAMVISLMKWDPDHRYKLLGKLMQTGDELLFVFDMNSPEIYKRSTKEDGKIKTSRTPVFPEDWKDQFGLPFSEHKKAMQITTFDGYAVFGLQDDRSRPASQVLQEPTVIQENTEKESEEKSYEQLSINQYPGYSTERTAAVSDRNYRPEEKPYPDLQKDLAFTR